MKIYLIKIDLSGKDCRDVPWNVSTKNVSTKVVGHAYLIFGAF